MQGVDVESNINESNEMLVIAPDRFFLRDHPG